MLLIRWIKEEDSSTMEIWPFFCGGLISKLILVKDAGLSWQVFSKSGPKLDYITVA